MRDINLPITQTFSLTIDTHNIDLSKAVDDGQGRLIVPLGNIVDDRISSLVETARRNGGKVLYATTSIEQKLEGMLLEYFMGPFTGHDDKRVMFEREILQSSALSYSAKKELVTKMINDRNLLVGSKKNAVQSHLKKIMEWRNAFAHGKIQHDSMTGCFIRYYSGEPKTMMLDDNYWDEVEKSFQECDVLLEEAKQQLQSRPNKSLKPTPQGGAA